MDPPSGRPAKVRREVFIASIKFAAFYPAGIIVLEGLLAYAMGLRDRILILIIGTVLAMVAYFAILIHWSRRRALRIGNFVKALEPRLREAAMTKHEGLVLILDNGLLLRVDNRFDIAAGESRLEAWIAAEPSGLVEKPAIADFVRWHRQYHGVRILKPIGSFGAGGIEQQRFDAVRLRLQSQHAQIALFERDLGRPEAPEGALREAVCFIEHPRWWAIGDLVSAEVDELAGLLRGLARSPTDAAFAWPSAVRRAGA